MPWWMLTALLLPFSCLLQAATDTEVERKSGELKTLQSQILQLQDSLNSDKGKQAELLNELRIAEQQIGRTARKLRVLEGSIQRQGERLEKLDVQRENERRALDRQRQILSRQLRAAYAMGRQERMKILLNQQDPAVVNRVMVYYDYLNKARSRQMSQIRESIEVLNQTEREISQEEQRLRELQSHLLAEQQQQEQNRQQRADVVAALSREIGDKDTTLQGLVTNEKELKQLVDQLQEALKDLPIAEVQHTPFKNKRGRLPWPTKGRLSARFGARKAGNLTWDGVIIAAPEGGEVRAVDHGRVAFADWLRGFGLMIIIDHGDGYMTLYGHNQSLYKETGEWVEAGEPVSTVGNSGGRIKAGVYFGIRYQGRPINPVKWCKRTRGNRVSTRLADPERVVRSEHNVSFQEMIL